MTTMTTPTSGSRDPALPGRQDGDVRGGPKVILRLEGALVLAVASFIYDQIGSGWALFAILFLVPDVSMLGYLLGRRIGAAIYNSCHNYILPTALGSYGYFAANHIAISVALIWIAHIGFDRLVGYGLKYGSAFRHTHLGLGPNHPFQP
jgi:hypothetical protein